MTKRLIHQEDIKIINLCALHNKTSKYKKFQAMRNKEHLTFVFK